MLTPMLTVGATALSWAAAAAAATAATAAAAAAFAAFAAAVAVVSLMGGLDARHHGIQQDRPRGCACRPHPTPRRTGTLHAVPHAQLRGLPHLLDASLHARVPPSSFRGHQRAPPAFPRRDSEYPCGVPALIPRQYRVAFGRQACSMSVPSDDDGAITSPARSVRHFSQREVHCEQRAQQSIGTAGALECAAPLALAAWHGGSAAARFTGRICCRPQVTVGHCRSYFCRVAAAAAAAAADGFADDVGWSVTAEHERRVAAGHKHGAGGCDNNGAESNCRSHEQHSCKGRQYEARENGRHVYHHTPHTSQEKSSSLMKDRTARTLISVEETICTTCTVPGKKTQGGAGTHTGHGTNTGHTDSRTSQPSQYPVHNKHKSKSAKAPVAGEGGWKKNRGRESGNEEWTTCMEEPDTPDTSDSEI